MSPRRIMCTLALSALMVLSPAGLAAAQAQAGPAVTIAPAGTFSRAGAAEISGTYDCGQSTGFAFIEVTLTQDVGRFAITGPGTAEIPACAPGTTSGSWTALAAGNGKFRGGSAFASARLVIDTTGVAENGMTVRLRG